MQSNLGDLKIWRNLGDLEIWRNRAQDSEEPGWKSQMNWTHRGMLRGRRALEEPRPNESRGTRARETSLKAMLRRMPRDTAAQDGTGPGAKRTQLEHPGLPEDVALEDYKNPIRQA